MDFSLGLIEVQALGHAIFVLDAMTKAADVEFVATERRLGGRLVTLVVKGQMSAVKASVDAGKELAQSLGCLKAAEVIARPHPEILKFLHLDQEKTGQDSSAPQKEAQLEKASPAEKGQTKKASQVVKTSDKPTSQRGRKKANTK